MSSPRKPKALVAQPVTSPLMVTTFKDGQRIASATTVSTAPLSVRLSKELLTMPLSPMLMVASSVSSFKESLCMPLSAMFIIFPSTVRFSNALLTILNAWMVSFSVAFSSTFFKFSFSRAPELIVIDVASMLMFSTTEPSSISLAAEKVFSPTEIVRLLIFVP